MGIQRGARAREPRTGQGSPQQRSEKQWEGIGKKCQGWGLGEGLEFGRSRREIRNSLHEEEQNQAQASSAAAKSKQSQAPAQVKAGGELGEDTVKLTWCLQSCRDALRIQERVMQNLSQIHQHRLC